MGQILDKTDKGREEIATRKHRLAPRLRTLLVLIDGRHTDQELLKQVGGLGLTQESIDELLKDGFISVHADTTKKPSPDQTLTKTQVVPTARVTEELAVPIASSTSPDTAPARSPETIAITATPSIASATDTAPSNEAALAASSYLPEGESQFQALYNFYTSTIRQLIGLRGYGLQLKVERASSIEEFGNLRQPYLEAVKNAKGDEVARTQRDQLDRLLYLGKPPAHLHPIV